MRPYPLWLRLSWWGAGLVLFLPALLPFGPMVEARIFPIRVAQEIIEPGRDRAFLHFTWRNRKVRSPAFIDLDVAVISKRDRFVETLRTDLSLPAAPPCSDIVPWSRSHAVDVGPHEQRFCVELSRTVDPCEPLDVSATVRYRGFAGWWEVPVALPPIHSDRAAGLCG